MVSFKFQDGSESEYHGVWLRDHCPCPQCVDPSSGQKLHVSGEIWTHFQGIEHIRRKSLHEIEIVWKKDRHISLFSSRELHRWASHWRRKHGEEAFSKYTDDIRHRPSILWHREQLVNAPIYMEFDTYMNDNTQFFSIGLSALQAYGLLYIRHVPYEKGVLERLAERIGPIMETFYGRTWDVKSVPHATNIAYTSMDLGYHHDLLYFEAPPGLQFLYCIRHDVTGGDNYFADAFRVAVDFQKLHPDAFKTLAECLITFHYQRGSHHLQFHRPTFVMNSPNRFMEVYYAPPFQGPLTYIAADRIEEFYRSFALFEQHLHRQEYKYPRRMQAGECIVFDNRRILHARSAFDPSIGERHLKGTYIMMDTFWDTYRDYQARMTIKS
jgi:gamma-butyrobetaine dioxygenase